MVGPLSADVPEAGGPGQDLLPLGVPPHHHPAVLLAQQTLQLWVDSILTGRSRVGCDKEADRRTTHEIMLKDKKGPQSYDLRIMIIVYYHRPVSSKEQS